MNFDFLSLLDGTMAMWFAFGFAVGYGLLPQPEWAKNIIDKVKSVFSAFGKGPPPDTPTKPTSNTA